MSEGARAECQHSSSRGPGVPSPKAGVQRKQPCGASGHQSQSRVTCRSALSSTVSSRPNPGGWSPQAGAAVGTHSQTLKWPGRGHTLVSRLPGSVLLWPQAQGRARRAAARLRGGADPNGDEGEAAGCPRGSVPRDCGRGADRGQRGSCGKREGTQGQQRERAPQETRAPA